MRLTLLLGAIYYFPVVLSQMLIGSQHDDYGCVTDGGYQWCESTQRCQRPWINPCPVDSVSIPEPTPSEPPTDTHKTDFCSTSSIQLCRMICPDPVCNSNQCALRSGSCCDYTCVDNIQGHRRSQNIPQNCASWYDGCNTCQINTDGSIGGCTMMMCFTTNTPECRSYYSTPYLTPTLSPPPTQLSSNCLHDSDCSSNKFCRQISATDLNKNCVDYSSLNSQCGGYVAPYMISRCRPGLECVNVMGLMIADAPGICKEPCNNNNIRDSYGNCVDHNCRSWYDGCNTCLVNSNRLLSCTEQYCNNRESPRCLSFINTNKLNIGDICFRFCEDSSQSNINRRMDCPLNSQCIDSNNIGFDSCHSPSICMSSGH